MNRVFRKLLLGGLLATTMWGIAPATTRADDYWNGYWGWYDNSYRPYYYRRNYYGQPYGRTYYNSPPAGGYYYGPTYPNYYRGGGVQIGPLQFGWW